MVRTWMEQRGPSALGRSGFLQSGKDLGQRRYARRLSGPRGCVTGFSDFNWLILSRFVAVGEVEVRETHSPHCFFSTAQLRRCPIKPHNSHQFNLSPTTSRPRPLCHLRTVIFKIERVSFFSFSRACRAPHSSGLCFQRCSAASRASPYSYQG